jgi:hypothetical protein
MLIGSRVHLVQEALFDSQISADSYVNRDEILVRDPSHGPGYLDVASKSWLWREMVRLTGQYSI